MVIKERKDHGVLWGSPCAPAGLGCRRPHAFRQLPNPAESVVPRLLVGGDSEIANDAENAVVAYLDSAFVHVVQVRDFRFELGRRSHRCRTYHSIAAESNVRQTREARSLNLLRVRRAPVRIHATSTKMPTTPTSETYIDGLCF